MATELAYTVTNIDRQTLKVVWSGLGNDYEGTAYIVSGYPDKSVQIVRASGSHTTTIQGTNDNTNYDTLNDPSDNALSALSDGIHQVIENTYKLRPITSAAAGSTTVTMILSTRGVDRAFV